MDIAKPYLLFLGDVHDQLAAKTAQGIVDWRPEWCVGQRRFFAAIRRWLLTMFASSSTISSLIPIFEPIGCASKASC